MFVVFLPSALHMFIATDHDKVPHVRSRVLSDRRRSYNVFYLIDIFTIRQSSTIWSFNISQTFWTNSYFLIIYKDYREQTLILPVKSLLVVNAPLQEKRAGFYVLGMKCTPIRGNGWLTLPYRRAIIIILCICSREADRPPYGFLCVCVWARK